MKSCKNYNKNDPFRLPRASTGAWWILTFVAIILGVPSLIAPSRGESTTVSLTTAGTLQVDRAGNLRADLADGLPSSGFFDVYQDTFSASATNAPAIPVTQASANTLLGTVIVNDTSFSLDGNNLPTTLASLFNKLNLGGGAFASSLPRLSSQLGVVNALPGLDQNSYATLVAANIVRYCSIPAAVRNPAFPMPAHVTASPASRSNTGFELEGPELVQILLQMQY